MSRRALTLIAPCFALALGCASPAREAAAPRREPGARALVWPDRFRAAQVLSAAEVVIEGPHSLLEHVFVAQQADNHDYSVRGTDEGLVIEARVRADGPGEPIRAQLDELALAVDRSIVVIERRALVPLTVTASGDVYYREVASESETRAPTLRISAPTWQD
jgi:hypothetical protein